MILGIILIGAGVFIFDSAIVKHLKGTPQYELHIYGGIVLIGIGGYFIFKGKKKQIKDSQNQDK